MVDDHIVSGRNICIGDAPPDLLLPLIDAIDVHVHATSLIDVAFCATTPANQKMLEERGIPSNLNVNFNPGIDLYIAPTTAVDQNLHTVINSEHPSVDSTAAYLASKCVFITQEEYLHTSIPSFPIELNRVLRDATIRELQGDRILQSIGVSSISLRPQSAYLKEKAENAGVDSAQQIILADVYLELGSSIDVIQNELKRHDSIIATGLHTASEKTVVVVAQPNGDPIDMTPIHSTLSKSNSHALRKAAAPDDRCEHALNDLPGWKLTSGIVKSLTGALKFPDVLRADAFVRAVHELARASNHHPEIRQNFNQIRICLATYEAGGVTELDILFAKQLSKLHVLMNQ